MLLQLVVNFANFRWNSTIFKQKNAAFRKYHPQGKFGQQEAENSEFCRFLIK